MATVDLSRWATDFGKRYYGVRAQQGRVLTDDDINESERIDAEDMRRTRLAVIGEAGSPDAGFSLTGFGKSPSGKPTFQVVAGSFYLGGQRLDLFSTEWFHEQKDWLTFLDSDPDAPAALANGSTRIDLVWLETVTHAVSGVEDGELIEQAHGGGDTTQRVRVRRRVKTRTVTAKDCAAAWVEATAAWAAEGTLRPDLEFGTDAQLKVTFQPLSSKPNLCTPPVTDGYLGAENQAIRVQIVDPTHYTWGFDNASPLYRVQVLTDTEPGPTNGLRVIIKMLTEPKDAVHWPRAGQIVELLPWAELLPNHEKLAEVVGLLAKVSRSYDPVTGKLAIQLETLTEVPATFGTEWMGRTDHGEIYDGDPQHLFHYMRVWNRGDDAAPDFRFLIKPGPNNNLGNTGLQVEFLQGPNRPGDFWVIAARPATPKVIVPWVLASGAAPNGLKQYRAPLGLIEWTADGAGNLSAQLLHDCRRTFLPLTKLKGCCTVTVGDGTTSFGQYTSIHAAVKALPPEGGVVCVLPGLYKEHVVIQDRINVTIHGCDGRSRVTSADQRDQQAPTFLIRRSRDISIERLAIEGGPRSAVQIESDALRVAVRDCLIQMRDVPTIWQAIYSTAVDVVLEGNVIDILSPEAAGIAVSAPNAYPPGTPVHTPPPNDPVLARATRGGIQIGGGSERVRIIGNTIRGGIWNGITLGSLRAVGGGDEGDIPDKPSSRDPCDPCKPADLTSDPADDPAEPVHYVSAGALHDVEIRHNLITDAGINGIGVVRMFNLSKAGAQPVLISVLGLRIVGNRIERCLRRTIEIVKQPMQWMVGYGGIALALASDLVIAENDITDNGVNDLEPVCGVFALMVRNLEVRHNRILRNGVRSGERASSAKNGPRGGIWVWLVIGIATNMKESLTSTSLSMGRMSGAMADICDNLVGTPLGRSLTMFCVGPCIVSRNRFETGGSPLKDLDLLATTVLLGNLGVSNEWTLGLLLVAILLLVGKPTTPADQDLYCGLAKIFGWIDFKNGGFQPPLSTWGTGKTLVSNNQISVRFADEGVKFALSSIAIGSLDDVGFIANQCEVETQNVYVATDATIVGGSVRVADNRFAETWMRALFSGLVAGGMNTTTDNQSTHCLSADALWPRSLVFRDNLAFVRAFCRNECGDLGY